jgi:peptidoglycan/LPS O-acetylase OafA/YrhL
VILAAAVADNDPATLAGVIIGRLAFFIVGGLLLFFGLRQRSAKQRNPSLAKTGKGLIIAGSIVLGLSVLALAASSTMPQ